MRQAVCPVEGCKQRAPDYWIARHVTIEHVRCGCGWVGVSIMHHIAQRRRTGHDVSTTCVAVEIIAAPGRLPSTADLQAEVDRLTCELMRYNGVDVDTIDRLQAENGELRERVERYRRVIIGMNDAHDYANKASACLSEALAVMIGHRS